MVYVLLALSAVFSAAVSAACNWFAGWAVLWQLPLLFIGCFLGLVLLFLLVLVVSCLETYDMIPISKDTLDSSFRFIKENTVCKLLSYKGNVFGIETPNFVELVVTKADPGVKGDTATNVTKPATVETGAEIKVPLFINEGDKIQIDTRTGEYLGRAKG